jgi:tRNA G10  N-methylase Trm11
MRVEKEKIEKLKGDIFSPDDYKKRVNGWLNTYWMDKKIYDLYDNIRERILALEAKKNADIKRIKEKQKTEIERKEIEQRAAMIKQNKIKSPSLKSNTPSVNRKLIKRRKSEILKKAYSALERRNSMKKSGGQRRRKSRKTYKKRI